MHASPMMTHPRGNLCAYGALRGPTYWSNMWWASSRSLPISKLIFDSMSNVGIFRARSLRCEWCLATSGVGISLLTFGMLLHSSKLGNSNMVLLSRLFATQPNANLPLVTVFPAKSVFQHVCLWVKKVDQFWPCQRFIALVVYDSVNFLS